MDINQIIPGWKGRLASPSRVDNFLQYQKGVKYDFGDMPEYTTEDFIKSLVDKREPTPNTLAGEAVHSVLEKCSYKTIPNSFSYMGFDFIINIDIELELPRLREIWVNKFYKGDRINGKVDCTDLGAIHDHKTTKQIDLDKYMNSIQWKMYLWITGRKEFVYNIFEVKIDENKLSINDFKQLKLYYYNGLYDEVEWTLDEYFHTLDTLQPRIYQYAKNNNIQIKGLETWQMK